MAAGMGHKVTAVDGTASIRLITLLLGGISGPDYGFSRGLYHATPGGGVSTVWKNETIITTNKWGHIWYNPWGRQPY